MYMTTCWAYGDVEVKVGQCELNGALEISHGDSRSTISVTLNDRQLRVVADEINEYLQGKEKAPSALERTGARV